MEAVLPVMGANIRRLRIERGLTQHALARRTGTVRTSIARIERGEQNPTVLLLAMIALGLEVPLSDLVRGCGPVEEP